MNEEQFRQMIKNGSKTFRDKNRTSNTGVSDKSESLDRSKICKTQRSEEVGEQYILRHCEVSFYASHGQQLDQDNKRYIIKPILDALVNLGLASSDKNITSEVTQRFNQADIDI